jgi:hypothetical protein
MIFICICYTCTHIHTYIQVLSVADFRSRGYLPAGDSLPNMPINFDHKFVGDEQMLGQTCQEACKRYQVSFASLKVYFASIVGLF